MSQEPSPTSYYQSFQAYFARPVAELAARSLTDGARIEFCMTSVLQGGDESVQEIFFLERSGGANQIQAGVAFEPEITFRLSPEAADAILSSKSENIGEIGVEIAKLIANSDPALKVSLKLNVGFMKLFTKGYLGVIGAGGKGFAQYLASRGLSGMGAIRAVISKLSK